MLDFLLQSVSAGMLFYGLWQMGNAKLRGPFFTAIAEVVTFIVGVKHHVWSLALIGFVLAIVQSRNFLKWRKENTNW